MRQQLKVSRPKYPWPFIPSPLTTALDEEESIWYDEDYADFMPPETIARYKRQKLVQATPYMSPTTTNVDRLRPIARFMIYLTLFDDYFGTTPADEFLPIRDRAIEVMTSQDPRAGEIGMFRQMAAARKEFLAMGMPQFWIERMAINSWKFMTYGMMEETYFRMSRTYPPPALYWQIRHHSIAMEPYTDMIEPATNFTLPVHIYNHPVIQRLKELLALVIVIQNDIVTIKKEMEVESEVFNIILVLQAEYAMSFEEACIETLRINDEYVNEMVALQASLRRGQPDFSPYQKEVENYAYHVGLMVTGIESWYYGGSGTGRYRPDGFIVPPYDKEGVSLPFDMVWT